MTPSLEEVHLGTPRSSVILVYVNVTQAILRYATTISRELCPTRFTPPGLLMRKEAVSQYRSASQLS